jgi:26S proteasome regulatory subunit N7
MSSESPLPAIPDLSLAQSLFTLCTQPPSSQLYANACTHLLSQIEKHAATPLYALLKDILPNWSQQTHDALKKRNEQEEEDLDKKLTEAKAMNGESEVSEALIAKFMFLARILDKVRTHSPTLENLADWGVF